MNFDQSVKTEHGVRHDIGEHQVFLPEVSEADLGGDLVSRFAVSKTFINELKAFTDSVMKDPLLSEAGKEAKLKDFRLRALDTLAIQLEGVEKFSEGIQRAEEELYRVPELHPQNAAEAIIDREIRDYFRGLSANEKTKILNEMKASPKYERMEIALLRAPYIGVDWQTKDVRESWNERRRQADPAAAHAIQVFKDQLEWGQKAMSFIAGIGVKSCGLKDETIKVLVRAGRDKAAKAFGFTQEQIEHTRRIIKIEDQRGR
ncbi:hypothetical protein ACAW63_10915 [Pseudomonas sp. QE6]|uniref:hypothetical protein n=1 Tax=Pseudomonas sp. QE6 TaxID=3242491 RepID=UPI003528D7D0